MSQTVYVALNGDDRNPGTLEKPFRNIQAAIRSLPVGQGGQVLIRGGDYVLDQPIRISDNEGGTAESRLVIRNYQAESVRIDGTALAADKLGAFILSSTRAVDIQGLEIFGAYTGITAVGAAEDIQILNNKVHDTQFTGIAGYSATPGSVKNLRVDGNTVYRTNLFNRDRPITQPGGWGMGITFVQTEGGTISNNTVYENYGEGIGFTLADGAVAKNNIVYDNFSVEMYMDNATNSTFENNFIFNTGNTGFYRRFAEGDPTAAASGIQLANERYRNAPPNPSRNDVIRNNIVIGGTNVLGYANYELGGGLKNVQILNNTFYGDDSTRSLLAIDADAHENTNIINNIFYKIDAKPATQLPTDLTGLNFASNLWYGGAAGLAASPTDINADPQFFQPGGLQAQDYRLRASSPAVDRALSTPALNGLIPQDFFGTNRPATGRDIGANERSLFQPVQPSIIRPANWTTDLNGDRTGDAFWHNALTGDVIIWELGNNVIQDSRLIANISTDWAMRGLIDLNGDRQADALWQNQTTGDIISWQFQNGKVTAVNSIPQRVSNDWTMVGFGDFNGDDKGDILWRHNGTQDTGVWLMDGNKILATNRPKRLDVSWQVAGMADLNRDGKTDILWQNPQTNQVEVWLMDGSQIAAATLLPPQSSPLWQVVAVNDFNRDNQADIIWQNRQTGQVDLWTMNGSAVQNRRTLGQLGDANWELVATQDFVGQSSPDLFWYNPNKAQASLWEIENRQINRSSRFSTGDRAWQPEVGKAMTADGKADILWRNANNGAVGLWQFGLDQTTNQITLSTNTRFTNTDPNWRGAF